MYLKKISLILYFLCVSLFTGCSTELTLKESIFQLKKKPVKSQSINIEDFLNHYMTKESLDEYSLNPELVGKYNVYRNLTKDNAIEDVNILFERLKTTYAGYIVFGGEVKFEEARQNILKEIVNEDINVVELKNIIIKNLSFIDDYHFLVESTKLKYFDDTKVALDVELEKKNGKYLLKDNSLSINIEEIQDLIKPSLDENGNIVYRVFYKGSNEDFPDLKWNELKNINHEDNINPEFDEINQVPILRIKEFYHLLEQKEQYDFVVEEIKKLNKPYAILDLRGNPGGNDILRKEMIESYSGESTSISADIIYYINLENPETSNLGNAEEILEYFNDIGVKKYNENHYFLDGSDELFEKEGVLFVLMDGHSASASEHTIDVLRRFNNTIFVGVPSSGMMISSSAYETVLPNSKMDIYWGNMYLNFEPSYFREFYGFEPDIWVEPEYAEERVLKLIENLRIESENKK